jgi:hypothetical protein
MPSPVKYLLIFLVVIMFSCDKSVFSVNCSGCTKDEPKTAEISISLNDISSSIYGEVVVSVYSGNLEDNILLTTFIANSADQATTVTLNKKYTFTATYQINGSSYTTVDAIFPRSKYEKSVCKDPCYYIYDNKVNLQLKYTN